MVYVNATQSGNEKGNKYHDDKGRFTFAPYQKFKGLEESAKRLSKMSSNIWKRGADEFLNNKEYHKAVSDERDKLFEMNAVDIEYKWPYSSETEKTKGIEITKEDGFVWKNREDYAVQDIHTGKWYLTKYYSDNLLSTWPDRFEEGERATVMFSPLDIALSKAIVKESKVKPEVYRGQFSNDARKNGNIVKKSNNKSWSLNKQWIENSDFVRQQASSTSKNNDEGTGYAFKVTVNEKNVVMLPEVLYSKKELDWDNSSTATMQWKELQSKKRLQQYDMVKLAGRDTVMAEFIVDVSENISPYKTIYGGTNNHIESIQLVNQQSELNHAHSDDYINKALRLHINEQGEVDDYGKEIQIKVNRAKNSLLNEIRGAQLQAIKDAVIRIDNSFTEKDIHTKEQRESIYNRIYKALKKYWMFIIPLVGRERLIEDEVDTGLKAEVNLLGIKSVNDFLKEQSKKAAESHTQTIYNTILDAANKGEEKVIKKEFTKEYLDKFSPNNWFKTKPTSKQVTSKLNNPKFVADNEELYNSVREKIEQGLNRAEIQKAIRSEYLNLSKKRANILVGNEMARSINSSQFLADLNFLKKTGKLDKAYKRLVSSTGHPCTVCQALIDKGDIPFEENFLNLGETISVKDGDKTTVFNCNYEPIESGNTHVNCKCGYMLILKED